MSEGKAEAELALEKGARSDSKCHFMALSCENSTVRIDGWLCILRYCWIGLIVLRLKTLRAIWIDGLYEIVFLSFFVFQTCFVQKHVSANSVTAGA